VLHEHPELVRSYWTRPPDAATVASWWASLSRDARTAYLSRVPRLIGNLGGIPYSMRDSANRAALAEDAAYPQLLTSRQRDALAQLRLALHPDGHATVQLVDYDLAGDGGGQPLAAVAYGDLDGASTTTWLAPGMGYNTATSMAWWGEAGRNLHDEQSHMAACVRPGSCAVVAWMGYDAPDLLSEQFGDAASSGSRRFAEELDADHETRAAAGSPVRVAIVAHSYGTTMAADALARTRYDVASFTMVGSAGIDLAQVPDLGALHVAALPTRSRMPGAAIFSTTAVDDDLAPLGARLAGRAEPNPLVAALSARVIGGAIAFSSDGDTRAGLLSVDGHNPVGVAVLPLINFLNGSPTIGHGYFDQRTQSLRNISAASLGDFAAFTGPVHRIGDDATRRSGTQEPGGRDSLPPASAVAAGDRRTRGARTGCGRDRLHRRGGGRSAGEHLLDALQRHGLRGAQVLGEEAHA
jgi:hypothetical protein